MSRVTSVTKSTLILNKIIEVYNTSDCLHDRSITRKKDCTEQNKFHLIAYKYNSRFETCPILYYLILRSRFRPR